jgi:hypothetical protein
MEKIAVSTASASPARRPDYAHWSVEELRQFARQLRVRDAGTKNRRELVELFAGPTRN